MRAALAFLFVLSVSSPALAGYAPDFDRGVNVASAVEAALEAASSAGGLVPAASPRPADNPVWVTMEKREVTAMDDALFKRAPVAQGEKVVVFEFRESELDQVSSSMMRSFSRAPGFFAHDTLESALADLREPAPLPSRSYKADQPLRVNQLLGLIKEETIVSNISALASYRNRYYKSATGIASSKWLQELWGKFSEGRPDIKVEAFKHASYPQESVILTITGAVEPHKVVVLGGHLDSIAGSGDNPAPGADDNASGIAVQHAVIEAIVNSGYRPSKTLKFMGYAAEEVGLRGSADVAAAFKRDAVTVEGMLNLDMVNYKGSTADIYFVSDNASAAQNAFLQKLVDTYTSYTWGVIKCGYACSDHASWTKNGFPASMPFESKFNEYNPYVHKATDTLSVTGGRAEHALKFAKLAAAYAVELAK